MPTLKLISLYCHAPDEMDWDEVYLKMNGKKIWPASEKYQKLKLGETALEVNINDIDIEDMVKIELWDYDKLSRNDKLGSFSFRTDERGKFQTEMKKIPGVKASYSLEWEYY